MCVFNWADISNSHRPCSFTREIQGYLLIAWAPGLWHCQVGCGHCLHGRHAARYDHVTCLNYFNQIQHSNRGRSGTNSSVLLQCSMILMPNYSPLPTSFTPKKSCKHQQGVPHLFQYRRGADLLPNWTAKEVHHSCGHGRGFGDLWPHHRRDHQRCLGRESMQEHGILWWWDCPGLESWMIGMTYTEVSE